MAGANKLKISVIIPAYNSENYIERCIDSVLNQTLKEIEIIIVNDGSADDTWKICEQIEEKNPTVHLIDKSNEGVTLARFAGLKIAKADYIVFIDADDWIDPDFLQELYREITNDEVDLVAANCMRECGDHRNVRKNGIEKGIYRGSEMKNVYSRMLWCKGFFEFGILPYLWNKIFRRNILLDIFSSVDYRIYDGEDVAIVMAYIAAVQSMKVIDSAKYHYYIHSGQVTQKKGKDFYENAARLYINLKEILRTKDCYEYILPQLNQYLRYMLWLGHQDNQNTVDYLKNLRKTNLDKATVAIYGAGNNGKKFYSQIIKEDYQVVAWVDKNYKKIGKIQLTEIESPMVLKRTCFDVVVITIANEEIREEVKVELMNLGINADKIVFM